MHVDHVDAVLDVDWSPTGKELCSASYDRTVRIFPQGQNRSREVYHVKRMQRVFAATFSGDARLVLWCEFQVQSLPLLLLKILKPLLDI